MTLEGIESLVYNHYGEAGRLAENINARLEQVGYENQGVNERPDLVVLNQTQMPSVLVEVGFINTDADNRPGGTIGACAHRGLTEGLGMWIDRRRQCCPLGRGMRDTEVSPESFGACGPVRVGRLGPAPTGD